MLALEGSSMTASYTGNKVLEVQILDPQRPALYIVIVLSCPLIGSRSVVAQQPIRGQLKTIAGLWGPRICTP